MTPTSTLLAAPISVPQAFSKKDSEPTWVCRLASFVLVAVMLIFSVFAVNQTSAHFKAQHDHQETLQLIPTISASDALIFTGFSSLPFTVYFFIYFIYRLDHQILSLTYALKESLFIPSFLRNPFYVFTSIHAP